MPHRPLLFFFFFFFIEYWSPRSPLIINPLARSEAVMVVQAAAPLIVHMPLAWKAWEFSLQWAEGWTAWLNGLAGAY